jgi:hypothetical protein
LWIQTHSKDFEYGMRTLQVKVLGPTKKEDNRKIAGCIMICDQDTINKKIV